MINGFTIFVFVWQVEYFYPDGQKKRPPARDRLKTWKEQTGAQGNKSFRCYDIKLNVTSTRRRPRSASKCHRWRKRWGMFSFLFQTSQRGIKTSRPVIKPPPALHTHTFTLTHHQKKKMGFSYTIRTTKKYDYSFWQIIQSSTPWYFTTPATSAADKFIYIYTYIYFFPLFRENYSTYNQKYDIKSWFLAWQKRN